MATERLLQVHRATTDCLFELSLSIDAEADTVTFREAYEYLPRPGDPGQENVYGVRTAYTDIERLVGGTPGADPARRLVDWFRALVRDGVLADGMPIRAARDLVKARFEQAGLPVEDADWFWMNSD